MLEFIESPIYNNWLQKNVPSNSLIITTPFIKFSALKRLLHFYKTFDDFTLAELKILIRGNKHDFLQGSSDTASIDFLASLQENHPDKVQVRLLRNLHMKSYMIDHTSLLITSGNLTHNGLMTISGSGNVEGGIASDDQEVLNKFSSYFNALFENGTDISSFVSSSDSRSWISPSGETEPGRRPRQRSMRSADANDSLPCLSMCSREWIASSLWHSKTTR